MVRSRAEVPPLKNAPLQGQQENPGDTGIVPPLGFFCCPSREPFDGKDVAAGTLQAAPCSLETQGPGKARAAENTSPALGTGQGRVRLGVTDGKGKQHSQGDSGQASHCSSIAARVSFFPPIPGARAHPGPCEEPEETQRMCRAWKGG